METGGYRRKFCIPFCLSGQQAIVCYCSHAIVPRGVSACFYLKKDLQYNNILYIINDKRRQKNKKITSKANFIAQIQKIYAKFIARFPPVIFIHLCAYHKSNPRDGLTAHNKVYTSVHPIIRMGVLRTIRYESSGSRLYWHTDLMQYVFLASPTAKGRPEADQP